MLAAVVCATLCGFRGVQPVVSWLTIHGTEMWHLLGFRRKPPVRQTYVNLLAELDPELLEKLLLEFAEQCVSEQCVSEQCVSEQCVSELCVSDEAVTTAANSTAANSATASVPLTDVEIWDGKTLRGTRKRDQRTEQVLVRMQRALGKILASHAIPDNTNELTVALELARQLILKGKLIVGDALYCQRELCEAVVQQEGDYLVTVKGNQPQLLREIEQAFVIPEGFSPLPSATNSRSATNRHDD